MSINLRYDKNMVTDLWCHLKVCIRPKQDFIQSLYGLEPFFVRKMPLWKRVMDIAGALLGLIVLAPLFMVVSLLIKISSPGAVLFRQERVGYGGKPFRIWKFRTMKADADTSVHQKHIRDLLQNATPMGKLNNDQRITPLGRVLRISGIDELPQLINVLRGEMSLVGPRPDVLYAVKDYHAWHYARFNSIPGLTGLWQVSGKNKVSYPEMMRLDLAYDRDRSFWLDLKIILLTVPTLIGQLKEALGHARQNTRASSMIISR
jgi:lipopolysaccharide/colanic/teichoic acid biosynthesis glycosyltransferase